jgi:hypothetical protein
MSNVTWIVNMQKAAVPTHLVMGRPLRQVA